jgi:hypothetical protein
MFPNLISPFGTQNPIFPARCVYSAVARLTGVRNGSAAGMRSDIVPNAAGEAESLFLVIELFCCLEKLVSHEGPMPLPKSEQVFSGFAADCSFLKFRMQRLH